MRILHTSDFHLGLQSGQFPRGEEHRLFFAWLNKTLDDQEVDALVIAGDIFDGINPSNEALRLYYQLIHDVQNSGVREVVIVGGNHDSASQLEAPRALLSSLHVHVVGGYSREVDQRTFLAPLRTRRSEEPACVCVALPFVHEWRLGIRTTDDPRVTRQAFKERFSNLYRELADLAEQEYPGLPLIGTGHLTMGKTEKGDFPREIHQVGFVDSLPVDIMDTRLKYVALGHIHRSFPVERGRIWYSGTPLPTSLPEMKHPRRVLLVDIATSIQEETSPRSDSSTFSSKITPLDVPLARQLLELTGTESDVLRQIQTLTWSTPLAPFLFIRVKTNTPDPQLSSKLRTALEIHSSEQRPLIVEIREELADAAPVDADATPLALEDLSPRQVFEKLCTQRGVEQTNDLIQAFHLVESIDQETLQKKIESITPGTKLPKSVKARGSSAT